MTSGTVSMGMIPWLSNDTLDNHKTGTLSINTGTFSISQGDINGLIGQAIHDALVMQHLADKKELSIQDVANVTAAAGAQLWVGASKGLAALYDLAIQTYTNKFYIASLVTFSRPEDDLDEEDRDSRKKKEPADLEHLTVDQLEMAWRLWVEQVIVIIKNRGFEGNIANVKTDLTRHIPALCDLGTTTVEVKLTNTGKHSDEDGRTLVSAHIEANGVEFDVDDIMGEKSPVPWEMLRKVRDLEDGESITIEKEVGPDTWAKQTSLIRELGPFVSGISPSSEEAKKLVGLAAVSNTYGIRNYTHTSSSGDTNKDPMILSVAETGEIIMVLKPSSSLRQAWAVTQLKPQFKLVEEIPG